MRNPLLAFVAVAAMAVPIAASAEEDGGPAPPPTESRGQEALALAVVVGRHSTTLPAPSRALLVQVGNGGASRAGQFVVAAGVHCLTHPSLMNDWSCDLAFANRTVRVTGLAAHEVIATLLENGVAGDGAMGAYGYEVTHLRCTISPRLIANHDEDGARCDWR